MTSFRKEAGHIATKCTQFFCYFKALSRIRASDPSGNTENLCGRLEEQAAASIKGLRLGTRGAIRQRFHQVTREKSQSTPGHLLSI